MVSQHPDHASKPYWHNEAFISTRFETHECYLSYSDLGVDEYKWDWEGKFVDEAVIERLLGDHFDYFKEYPLGKEKFLTFRLPNPNVETEFRMGRALMGILSAAGLAKQVGLHTPPIFEVIIPMVESAEEMIDIEEAFDELASLRHRLYKLGNDSLRHLEVIPLFEQVSTIINSDQILRKYISLHKWKFGKVPSYIRPYVARSDPALNSGIVPTVLAIKIALSKYKQLENELGINFYPIIGSASLPFRGGLNPLMAENFINEYKGVRTALIQSAFRYDYPKTEVVKALKQLKVGLPKGIACSVSTHEQKDLLTIIKMFENAYKPTIESLAPIINKVASYLPKRRERVQHVGLFGYSRGVGNVKLPRAIGFTGALYSIGIPPELIGTGRGLMEAESTGKLELIEKYYINLKSDLLRAGKYLNKDVVKALAKKSKDFDGILDDVTYIEKYLGAELQPETEDEKKHNKLTGIIFKRVGNGKAVENQIQKAAILRKSLG